MCIRDSSRAELDFEADLVQSLGGNALVTEALDPREIGIGNRHGYYVEPILVGFHPPDRQIQDFGKRVPVFSTG